jgi:peptidoglycan/xylan/chitin deacetylase (PgdA/CDA1 family)/folate-dependent phosphoribosylglycinamide formyltransferase PurN
VEPTGLLLDTEVRSFRQRRRSLARNIRVNGWSYPFFRIAEAISTATSSAVNRTAISPDEITQVLRKAFPERCFSLAELAEKYGMPLIAAGNLNGDAAVAALGDCGADLGIVLGTRILKPSTFGVPRQGCINLHKGKVPEYRGMPPGFWELYDGATTAGVTVHFVDKGLDTGDIVATGAVDIAKTETPESLLEKLHAEGAKTLASAVAQIRDGTATRQLQPKVETTPRSKPSREQLNSLRRRLPHWNWKKKTPWSVIGRNIHLLLVYYSGLYWAVRFSHRLSKSRGAIFLHHRVNDYSKDALTVDTHTFAAQLLAIARHYPVSSTAEIVDRILTRKPIQPTTVAVHFDDCYRDIFTNGAPILKALGIPACAFINSGYVDTDRSFPHDIAKYPFVYEMLRTSDIQAWSDLGLEVGAHTVNHVDLGKCDEEAAQQEITQCGRALQGMIGKPVTLFSFPFGRLDNIRPGIRRMIRDAGYAALFSAHGGFVGPRTVNDDIPRMGANHEAAPLYCLLQIEGLTRAQLIAKLRRRRPDPAMSAME